jgi:D-serine deaminase-like pyridoxal phosphate-dependent protein
VDSLEGASLLAAAAARIGREIEVRLEIDTGMRRTGVPYEQALTLAKRVSELPFIRLNGIYTYRGALSEGKPTLDLMRAGAEEGKLMVDLADRIRAEGIPLEDVSVGSTPTAAFVAAVPGITEIRPGTYVFQDRMQARFGVCGPGDWAASVRVTVVSRPAEDLAVIDGGSKTFATDVQPNMEPLQLKGYGKILELEDAVFERLSEEHGMLRLGSSAQAANVAIGDVLHIVPNHICSTINLHNQVVFHSGDGSYSTAPVLARGMLE